MKYKLDQSVVYNGEHAAVWDYSPRLEKYLIIQGEKKIEVSEEQLSPFVKGTPAFSIALLDHRNGNINRELERYAEKPAEDLTAEDLDTIDYLRTERNRNSDQIKQIQAELEEAVEPIGEDCPPANGGYL
jgi:hypothetical protein